MQIKNISMCAILAAVIASSASAADIGTAFTYQGTLENGSGPVSDTCDFRIGLWDADVAGNQVGTSPQTASMVDVVGGVFTVSLDYGAGAVDGTARWLEIEVQCPGDAGFVLLSPRVELTAAPHATRAVSGVGPPNALEIDSANGRVGIGTAAPAQPLHVVGTMLSENPGTSPTGSTVRFGGPSSDPGVVIQRGDGVGGVARQWDIVVEHTNDLEIRDNTAGSVERMVIDTTGRVGIGTISPTEQLDVVGNIHASGTLASGNSIVVDGTAYTITSDADLEVHLADGRVMRYESNEIAPNVMGGHSDNVVTLGVRGATIAGGGRQDDGGLPLGYNRVTDDYGSIGGGQGNQAGDAAGSTADKQGATVGGGSFNTASGAMATVAGGEVNSAVGYSATVGGGSGNAATSSFATVSGGTGNSATGHASTIPGGGLNTATGSNSFAAGFRAKSFDAGTFVWADSAGFDFTSTGPNQFLIRAGGGVGINTNAPAEALDVAGNIHASGTIASGNSITIDGTAHTISSDADLEMHVADGRALRLETTATAPNIIGGYSGNFVSTGTTGAIIAGGGSPHSADGSGYRCDNSFQLCGRCSVSNSPCGSDFSCPSNQTCQPQQSDCSPGATCELNEPVVCVGGPDDGNVCGICQGGALSGNSCFQEIDCFTGSSCIPNQSECSSPGICVKNSGANRVFALAGAIGGGVNNKAGGTVSTVAGGFDNQASEYGDAVSGGAGNMAKGGNSTIPGGTGNSAGGYCSFAAGCFAQVRDAIAVGNSSGDFGTFVWSDGSTVFTSTGPNQFLIRASGGVGINTNDPDVQLEIAGGTELNLSDNTGWLMIGDQDSANLAFDTNEVQARSDGIAAALALNPSGGQVSIASATGLTLINGTLRVGTDTLYADPSTEFVGLNTTSPTERLHVVGNIVYTGTITDISDKRLKQNIAPVENATSKIQKLRGVYFNMTDTPDVRDVGLIAQDVQAVLPEAVSVVDREKGYLGVAYPSVIPLLVEAIKEQDNAIADKNCRIIELEAGNKELEQRLTRLEALLNASPSTEEGNVR